MTTVEVRRRTWTVEEYHRMAEVGILSEGDRVELLGGEIVWMTPMGSRHAAGVTNLTHLLVRRVGGPWLVRVQQPVVLDGASEPEPDIAVVRYREDSYLAAHPRPADIALLIEVADSSIGIDRAWKLPLYAAAGVPEVWLVDLTANRVEVHAQPGANGYGSVQSAGLGELVSSAAVPDLTIGVTEILGPVQA